MFSSWLRACRYECFGAIEIRIADRDDIVTSNRVWPARRQARPDTPKPPIA